MKIDLSRISICGVHDFKNAIINLSNDMSIYRLKSPYTPSPCISNRNNIVRYGTTVNMIIASVMVMYVGWSTLYIDLLLKTKDPIRVWLLDIFCSVFSCMYC